LSLDPLAADRVFVGCEAGDIAFGTRKISDESCGNRIANLHEDDRYGDSISAQRHSARGIGSEEHVGF
jgi:hypothetical protein